MTLLYLSRPAVWVPPTVLSNAELVERVRALYTGDPDQWTLIELGIDLIFGASQSVSRHKNLDPGARIAAKAVEAARACLATHDLAPEDVDLLVYGGIGREYLEPATAMEVAARLGLERIRGMDVTSACASQLLGVLTACAWLTMDSRLNTALVCSAELNPEAAIYGIQTVDELPRLGAGLTLGDAAGAWLVTRAPLPGGGIRLVAQDTLSLPEHWQLSTTTIGGRFAAHSSEMMRVGAGGADLLGELLDRIGWTKDSVDQYLLHQPGHAMHRKVVSELGIPPERAINVHPTYGNTASVAVATATAEYFRRSPPPDGARLVFVALGAGLTGCVLAGEWVAA